VYDFGCASCQILAAYVQTFKAYEARDGERTGLSGARRVAEIIHMVFLSPIRLVGPVAAGELDFAATPLRTGAAADA
jgi:hypothetical protein